MLQNSNQVILSASYLPNIQYFSKLLTYPEVIIEIFDTYQKQSYRNRTTILGANGPLDLVIPVKRPDGNSTKTCNVQIDYDMPWQKTHWKAIISSYKHSPFFDIFEPELEPVYTRNFKYLVDWNLTIIDTILKITGFQAHYKKSNSYIIAEKSLRDFRDTIHPKIRMHAHDHEFSQIHYFQVFDKKFGFIPNLSFIDLLFNEGPQAVYLCKKCIKKGQPEKLPD
jgi:hypothetical protein